MLVCNVSQRPPRRAITVAIAEAGAAADEPGTGNIVFATLVDDPASVGETVDAYLGEILLEAASASTVLDASIPATYAADVTEAATAADVLSATLTGGVVTFDGILGSFMTLSNGNLTATHNAINSTPTGARSAAVQSSGKYYFEITVAAYNGGGDGAGILLSSGTYADMCNTATNCTSVNFSSGNISTNNTFSGKSLAALAPGAVLGFAIDLTARTAWIRKGAGNWNNDATHNPATGAGGVTIAATGGFSPAIVFNSWVGDNGTGNFGATAFANAAPSGFGNWSP